MDAFDLLAMTIIKEVRGLVQNETVKILHGTFIAAEAEDANLSKINIEGIEVRWAQKLEHVTGLTANDQVLCLKGPNTPVTIIGVVVGDITVANLNPEG